MNARIRIHPFFPITLLQMLRHGEREAAIELVTKEFLTAATESRRSSVGDGADADGVVLLPSLSTQRELSYPEVSPTATCNRSSYDEPIL